MIDALAATPFVFFTGKGGVGKTSTACAVAVAIAGGGKRVLLVSTDPASNLDEVLGQPLGTAPTPLASGPTLFAMNIDPEAAARAYRERVVAPYRGVLPDSAIASIEEQLSGACTVEIAAFDEFSKLLGEPQARRDFDHIIFDTAPTGHTLRLLELPGAWTGFLEGSAGDTSCLGPLAGLEGQRALYAASLRTLVDPALTTVVLVARPEKSALAEAGRTKQELQSLGVSNVMLVVNGLFVATARRDPIALALEARGREAMRSIPKSVATLPRIVLPLLASSVVGLPAVRAFAARIRTGDASQECPRKAVAVRPRTGGLADLLGALAEKGHGVIMTVGKGGVGKTTVAATVATELARRGHDVLLTTTDRAAHLRATVDPGIPHLRVERIDPVAETRAYTARVLDAAGAGLDAAGRALLEEDLRSPCTEEIAVFQAFAQVVQRGTSGFVVIDTAPTGHTLLLLDATESYHREVARTRGQVPEAVRELLPRLRDPDFTRVLVVTLPEATPVHEAAKLQSDLRRAGIRPYAWVVNQSLSALAVTDPVLVARQANEQRYIEEVEQEHATRAICIPWFAQVPTGLDLGHLLTMPPPS